MNNLKTIIKHLNKYYEEARANVERAESRVNVQGFRVPMTPAGRRAEFRKLAKEKEKATRRVYAAEKSRGIKLARITVDWKKSRMWGNCPRVSARVWSKLGEYWEGTGYANGCGYDKESSAIASALRGCPAWDFEIFHNMKKQKNASHPFCYGKQYALPAFAFGGAGVSCLHQWVNMSGLKWSEAHGRAFDYYEING